jgi:NAD(P)H-hydrate epimerase
MNKTEIKDFILKLKRSSESHKYDYGHVLAVAGSESMPGAGVLAVNAAMRCGAGLVTYAVKENFFNAACALSKPETMYLVYKNSGDIIKFIEKRKVSSLIIGPGLENNGGLASFAEEIILKTETPAVLDASVLPVFSYEVFRTANKRPVVFTPHLGEFSKMTGISPKEILTGAEKTVSDFAKKHNAVLVLKGHRTLISDGQYSYVNYTGTPAMATAGSGDVLSGMIAAFLARGFDAFSASKFAAYFHGLAGELSAKDKGENGVIASDISENIPKALKEAANEF